LPKIFAVKARLFKKGGAAMAALAVKAAKEAEDVNTGKGA
jgi:hypothetical protein